MKTWRALSLVAILAISAGSAQALVVEYWANNQPRVLKPVRAAPPKARAYRLDDLPLVQTEPAVLRVGNTIYSLDQEGLYRIRENDSKVARQTILYSGNVWRFAGHLSRVYVYGDRHQREDQAAWDKHVQSGEPLSLQCGFISMFVQHHLSQQKIGARLVGCAKGSNWKYYDDGHALLEICDPADGRWVLFDPTLGARFRDGGRVLSLLETTRRYRAGLRPEIEFLNAGQKIDPLTDYEALYTKHLPDKGAVPAFVRKFKPLLENDVAAIHGWYGQVMQVPVIGNYFLPESDAEDALLRTAPSWKDLVRLSPVEFRKRFYAEPCCAPQKAVDKKEPQ